MSQAIASTHFVPTRRVRPRLIVLGVLTTFILIGNTWYQTATWAAVVHGRIATEEEKPIRRVVVTIQSPQSGLPSAIARSTTTDENGGFRFEGLPPGGYLLEASKPGWVDAQQTVVVMEENAEGEIYVHLVMNLTFWSRALVTIRLGILVYVLLFGVLVLAANYWIVPRPSREIAVTGWGFMLASVLIACIKLGWIQALVLAAMGTAAGGLIHKVGSRTAALKIRQLEEEARELAARRRQEKDRLAALVGKSGIALTDLKACGSASVEGEIIEVRALHGFVARQTQIVVTMLDGATPVVEAQQEPEESNTQSGQADASRG